MICKIRKWELSDAADLAAALSNKKVQDNLRDGLPYPYTEQDGIEFISAMHFGRTTFTNRPQSCDIISEKTIGGKGL